MLSLNFSKHCKVQARWCWNWGHIYDVLSEIEQVEEVVLAHPLKTRLIAEAQIKTDSLDALALATLLRDNLIERAHVPSKATRARKELLRQRLDWARKRPGWQWVARATLAASTATNVRGARRPISPSPLWHGGCV